MDLFGQNGKQKVPFSKFFGTRPEILINAEHMVK
jgi:hypothetical protein